MPHVFMNPERLFHEVEKRLRAQPPSVREEIIDALREELARERRHTTPISTVQIERLRRVEAEALRHMLEALNRCTDLSQTVDEVLRQTRSLLMVDSCTVGLNDPSGGVRLIGALGYPEDVRLVGRLMRSAAGDTIRETRQPLTIDDAQSDPSCTKFEGAAELVKSWAGLPLLVEGEMIGILSLDRHSLAPFDEDEVRRAKALAFSAAAAIRRAELIDKLRRYASLLERSLDISHAIFEGQPAEQVARVVLEGALRLGQYPGGLLFLERHGAVVVVSGAGSAGEVELQGRAGQPVPAALLGVTSSRLEPAAAGAYAALFGVDRLAWPVFVVPLTVEERPIGALALLDPNGETPDDRLLSAYASRAAAACRYSRNQS